MAPTTSSNDIDYVIGRVVEEYFQRLERGDRPQLDEFAERYPGIGRLLKKVIPALQAAEQVSGASVNGVVAGGHDRQLGDFRIIRQIGRGGMGIVYEADQVSMKRRVALKVLPLAGLVDELKIRRFQNEVRAVAALDHPNIVSVYMVGEERGVHYFAMQLIRGHSLSQVIASLRHVRNESEVLDGLSLSRVTGVGRGDRGVYRNLAATTEPVPSDLHQQAKPEQIETVARTDGSTVPCSTRREYFRSVAALGIQAAMALQHAHDQGVIHRDVKPANLLLDSSAKLYLTDFGLARIEADVGVTMTGDLLGTLRYMAPEQALAKRAIVDHRADIYSLAATLYELLTLQPAYLAEDRQQLLKKIAFEDPAPLRRIDPDIPAEMETIVHKAMSKDIDQRYSSAQELADDLRLHLENRPIKAKPPTALERISKWTRRNPILTWATIVTLVLVTATLAVSRFFIAKERDIAETAQESLETERWARTHAIPEIRRLVDEDRFTEALALALEAERQIPGDPNLEKLWPEFSVETSIRTDPNGVDISLREWNATGSEWRHIGTTPIDRVRLPKGHFHWKLTRIDYTTLVLLRATDRKMQFSLERSDRFPPDMVKVTGGKTYITLAKVANDGLVGVGDYLIDRYEVTNRQFQQFVDQRGYESRKFWRHRFVKDGAPISWEEAMALFVDSTGEAGPAGWKAGRYPEGEQDYPVRGVSWYEAAAYAEFVEKRLPAVHHWSRAADIWAATYIVPVSNIDKKAPSAFGSYFGVGGSGAFDMAGNVKEWCWNGTGNGKRYILGGAWNEPEYMFNYPDVRFPLARSENYGFRCVKILSEEETSPKIDDDIFQHHRDLEKEKRVSDEEFAIHLSAFSYDHGPLNETILVARETEDYSHEKIVLDPGPGKERLTVHFYRPSRIALPYQTVIYFPPANTLFKDHFDETILPPEIAFLVKNGRAVMYPIYKGTFDGEEGLPTANAAFTTTYRDHMVAWRRQLGRTIDYLEKRADVDGESVAYYGYSWGALLGAIFPAIEDRIKVAVLSGAGPSQKTYPAVDVVTFAPRVKIPVLMLNGKYNPFHPIELSVKPLFRLLGTPEDHKRLEVYESGAFIPPKNLTQETVAWLDKYLGPVRRKTE